MLDFEQLHLCTDIKDKVVIVHAMKPQMVAKIKLHSFLTSSIDTVGWSS
jgi:hypothetical protein